MKKFLLLIGLMFWLGASAQNEMEFNDTVVSAEMTEGVSIGQTSMLQMVQGFAPIPVDAGLIKEEIYPLGKGWLFKKHHIEQAIELCPSISKSKPSQAETLSQQNVEEFDDTGLELNFGYSLIFNPGYEENGKLHLNKAGFAYSLGFVAGFTKSDRYGTLCDFVAKVGFETCHNRKMGLGGDFMVGYGKSSGDMFLYKNILEDEEPLSVMPYALWGKRYGGQLWIKTGLLGKADVLLFVRLIKAPDPEEIEPMSLYHYNLWRQENWSFGVILRYKM